MALLIILIIACCLRFCSLGKYPLNDDEALSALAAAQGTSYASAFVIGDDLTKSQPAYESLTRLVFQIFGASDLSARLVPAIAGVILALTPLLAWRVIGLPAAVVWSLLLAISPIFVTTSRSASAASLAAMGWMIAGMAWLGMQGDEQARSYRIFGAVGLGIVLASGAKAFTGALVIGVTLLLWKGASLLMSKKSEKPPMKQATDTRYFWVVIGAILVFTMGLGLSLEGLANFFDAIAEWFQGWREASPYQISTILVMLPVYSPILLLFGSIGVISALRGREREPLLASLMALVALIVVILYPSKDPEDLIWIVLPLGYLASRILAKLLEEQLNDPNEMWVSGLTVILLVLMLVASIQLVAIIGEEFEINPQVRFQRFVTLLGFSIVVVVLFGMGWGWRGARRSVLWVLACLAAILSVSGLWRLNYTDNVVAGRELWRARVASLGLHILLQSLESTSQTNTGIPNGLPIQFLGDPTPSLVWALREQKPMGDDITSENAAPAIVLAPEAIGEINFQSDYIGQSIAIGESWGWKTPIPPKFFKWWLKRSAPVTIEKWLLLIREDIAFLGAEAE